MRRNAFKSAIVQKFFDFFGRSSVETGELHAVETAVFDHVKHGFQSVILDFFTDGIQLNTELFHDYTHHISPAFSVMIISLRKLTAFSSPSFGDMRLSSCSIEILSS